MKKDFFVFIALIISIVLCTIIIVVSRANYPQHEQQNIASVKLCPLKVLFNPFSRTLHSWHVKEFYCATYKRSGQNDSEWTLLDQEGKITGWFKEPQDPDHIVVVEKRDQSK